MILMDIYVSVIHSETLRVMTSLSVHCAVISSRDRLLKMKGYVNTPAVISVICITIVIVLAVLQMNQPVYVLQRGTHSTRNVMSQTDFIRYVTLCLRYIRLSLRYVIFKLRYLYVTLSLRYVIVTLCKVTLCALRHIIHFVMCPTPYVYIVILDFPDKGT